LQKHIKNVHGKSTAMRGFKFVSMENYLKTKHMKKTKIKKMLELGASELLTREQLKKCNGW